MTVQFCIQEDFLPACLMTSPFK